jgi:hypothetical protein
MVSVTLKMTGGNVIMMVVTALNYVSKKVGLGIMSVMISIILSLVVMMEVIVVVKVSTQLTVPNATVWILVSYTQRQETLDLRYLTLLCDNLKNRMLRVL